MNDRNCNHAKDCITCEQVDMMNTYRQLWVEHVLWTRFFIVSTTFSLPDLPFVTQRLLRNPVDFANEFRPLYGEKTAARFECLLTEHLLIAAKLVNAAKAGDTAHVNRLRTLWYANAQEIACFLASINPFWSQCIWQKLLFDHLRMTEEEAVLQLTGQYEQSIEEYDAIQAEALKMADVMACGIIKQFCCHSPEEDNKETTKVANAPMDDTQTAASLSPLPHRPARRGRYQRVAQKPSI